MYENNFIINDGIIYDATDICSKQYRCANAIWLLSGLAFTYKAIIDICNNDPGHGRSRIDGTNVSHKKCFR